MKTIKKTLAFAGYGLVAFAVAVLAVVCMAAVWHLLTPESVAFVFDDDRATIYAVACFVAIGTLLCFASDDFYGRIDKG